MKKLVAVLLAIMLLASMCFGMTACGSTSAPAADSVDAAPAAEDASGGSPYAGETIEFWDMAWGSDSARYEAEAKKIIDAFTAETGIIVNYTAVPWTNWYETFVTAVASNTNPDISTGSGYQAFQFSALGYIEPLDDVYEELEASGELQGFMTRALDLMYYDGHYRALPWMADVRGLLYNKTMLDENGIDVPTNWDELEAACVKLSEAGIYGFAIPSDSAGKQTVYQFAYNNGGGVMTADGQVSVYCDENREAVAFLARLGEKGCLYPAAAGMTGSETQAAFLNGEFCFMITTPALAEANYDLVDFEIGVAEPLAAPNGNHGGFFSANNIMIYANSEHKEAAKEFLKYWSANELPMFTKGTASGIPVRAEFYEDPYFSESKFLTMAFNEFIPIGGNAVWRMTSNFPEANDLDGLTEWTALAQGITMGEDADALLKAVDDAAREVMGQ